MIQVNLFTKQKETHRRRRQIYGYQKGKGWGGQKSGIKFSLDKHHGHTKGRDKGI